MADRRMLNRIVTNSDAFVDMPFSSQALYVHLNMEADDDGFVNNPKTIAKNIGAKVKDLEILLQKNFLIGFSSGIVAITHWKINNIIRNDRKKETIFKQELNQLCTNINGFYELLATTSQPNAANCQPTDNQVTTTSQPVDNPINIINLNNINKDKENIKEEINKEEKKTEPSNEDSGQSIYSPLPFTQFLIDNQIIENDNAQVVPINISIYRFKDKFTNDQLKTVANEIYKEIVIKELVNMEAVNYFKINFRERMAKLENENR